MFCLIQIAYYQLYRVVCCSVKLSYYYIALWFILYFIAIPQSMLRSKLYELKSSTRIEHTQSLIPFSLTLPPSPASRPLFQSRRVSIVSLPPQKPRRSREPMLLNIWWFGRGLLFQMLAEWERMNSLARQVLLDQSVLRIGSVLRVGPGSDFNPSSRSEMRISGNWS